MKHITTILFLGFALMFSGCGGGGSTESNVAAPVPTPVTVGPASLQIIDSVVGTGTTAVAGSTISVHYTGWLYSATAANFKGAPFDTSIGKAPFTFRLGVGQVIAGWDQGVVGMRVGGKRTLAIPSSQAYGAAGISGLIPPNTALVFDVELLTVQ